MLRDKNGGSQAVKLLKDAVKGYISNLSPELIGRRIVARIYANLEGLDKNEKGMRILARFAAVFLREDSFFDFIGVADAQIIRSKIAGA